MRRVMVFASAAVILLAAFSGAALATTFCASKSSGTGKDDELKGDVCYNTIKGLRGDDVIFGYGGGDTLFGNQGDDDLDGGVGGDLIRGGYGNDTISAGADEKRDEIYCGDGRDKASGDALDFFSSDCEKVILSIE